MTAFDDLSDFDLLQLIGFDAKANSEGFNYACVNWTWIFDSPALNAAFAEAHGGNGRAMWEALNATFDQREAWWNAHTHPTQIEPLEAHEAEVEPHDA
jgi:hypothetical protein